MQKDVYKTKKAPEKLLTPQYRIVTDQLNPEDNRIILLTPVAKEIKDAYKEKIRALALRVHQLRQPL